jgi:MerR family transcriptional regulator, light-induced transcriptional regulator
MGQVPHDQSGSTKSARSAARPASVDGVSVVTAAQRVGVATSTLRAWERRYGLAPSARTSGGHRRYSADDVAKLQRMQQLVESGMSTARAATMGTSDTSEHHDGAARSGDAASRFAAGVRALSPGLTGQAAARLLRERGAAAAWTEVFVPYLQELGRQWARTGGGVQDEHVAVAALQAALRSYAARQIGRARTVHVVAAALPGEAHTLPLDALAAALADAGCATSVLYDVPEPTLYAAVQRHPGAVVVLWARGRADVALLRGVCSLAPAVCAAGPGWRRARLPKPVRYVRSLPAAVTAVQAFLASSSDGRRIG